MKLFLEKLKTDPKSVAFDETIAEIDAHYDFTPSAFKNGELQNQAGQNNGSCKIFSFAKLNGLTVDETLNCFGSYYREDVLKNPQGNDHQNIRNFMKHGWKGIEFQRDALMPKKS